MNILYKKNSEGRENIFVSPSGNESNNTEPRDGYNVRNE